MFSQSGIGVAQRRQKRHRLGGDELGHDMGEIESRVARVQLGDMHEIGVGAYLVGEAVHGG
jgi:hypothetical protein